MDTKTLCTKAGLLLLCSLSVALSYRIAWAWRHDEPHFWIHLMIAWMTAAAILTAVWYLGTHRKIHLPASVATIWVILALLSLGSFLPTKLERELFVVIAVLSAAIYAFTERFRPAAVRALLVVVAGVLFGAYVLSTTIAPSHLRIEVRNDQDNRYWAYPIRGNELLYARPSVADVPAGSAVHTAHLAIRNDTEKYGIRFGGAPADVFIYGLGLSVRLGLWHVAIAEFPAARLSDLAWPVKTRSSILQADADHILLRRKFPLEQTWLIVSLSQLTADTPSAIDRVKIGLVLIFVGLNLFIAFRAETARGMKRLFDTPDTGAPDFVAESGAAVLFVAALLHVSYLLHPWYAYSLALVLSAAVMFRLAPVRAWLAKRVESPADPAAVWETHTLFAVAALLIVSRVPELVLTPRFWAEDATHYFWFAASHEAWSTLFYQNEYKLILSNLAAIASRLLPLEWAPLPFTLVALFTQLAAVAVVLYGNGKLWQGLVRKTVAVAIIIYAPSSEEIWLNANGTQYYCALIAALLLCDEPQRYSRRHRVMVRGGLLVCGLNGVLSGTLAPLYWLSWFRERDRERLNQAAILSLMAGLQLLLVLTANNPAERGELPSAGDLGWIIAIKGMLLPLQLDWAYGLYYLTTQDVETSQGTHWEIGGGGLLFGCLVVLGAASYALKRSDAFYLALAFLILTSVVSLFGLGGTGNRALTVPLLGNRYFYASSALWLLALFAFCLEWFAAGRSRMVSAASAALLVMALANSVVIFYSADVSKPDWPQWQNEVAAWRQDPSRPIRIWPEPWTLSLPADTASR